MDLCEISEGERKRENVHQSLLLRFSRTFTRSTRVLNTCRRIRVTCIQKGERKAERTKRVAQFVSVELFQHLGRVRETLPPALYPCRTSEQEEWPHQEKKKKKGNTRIELRYHFGWRCRPWRGSDTRRTANGVSSSTTENSTYLGDGGEDNAVGRVGCSRRPPAAYRQRAAGTAAIGARNIVGLSRSHAGNRNETQMRREVPDR